MNAINIIIIIIFATASANDMLLFTPRMTTASLLRTGYNAETSMQYPSILYPCFSHSNPSPPFLVKTEPQPMYTFVFRAARNRVFFSVGFPIAQYT